jgi:hypothetical protein
MRAQTDARQAKHIYHVYNRRCLDRDGEDFRK